MMLAVVQKKCQPEIAILNNEINMATLLISPFETIKVIEVDLLTMIAVLQRGMFENAIKVEQERLLLHQEDVMITVEVMSEIKVDLIEILRLAIEMWVVSVIARQQRIDLEILVLIRIKASHHET